MKNALQELKEKVSHFTQNTPLSEEEWHEFSSNTVVALMAGGVGSRFREVPNSKDSHKGAHTLPNGDTMIEMAIRMYKDAGITNFVALVFHKAESIEEKLGDGSQLGVNIKYSYDPEQPVGKGGAILNALQNGSIPRDKTVIVHNPDDVIVDFEGSFPKHIATGHIRGVEAGSLASVVVVDATPYAFSGMKVVDNKVSQIEMYPMIPLPTHIGVTIFDPKSYPLFEENFDLEHKSDFEKVLFPILAEKDQLTAVSIPNDNWIAVNNLKAYNQLVDRLG